MLSHSLVAEKERRLVPFHKHYEPPASFVSCSRDNFRQKTAGSRSTRASLTAPHRFKLPEQLAMNLSDGFRRHFRLPIKGQQAVNLLLYIGQLRITKACEKFHRSDSLHQVA